MIAHDKGWSMSECDIELDAFIAREIFRRTVLPEKVWCEPNYDDPGCSVSSDQVSEAVEGSGRFRSYAMVSEGYNRETHEPPGNALDEYVTQIQGYGHVWLEWIPEYSADDSDACRVLDHILTRTSGLPDVQIKYDPYAGAWNVRLNDCKNEPVEAQHPSRPMAICLAARAWKEKQ